MRTIVPCIEIRASSLMRHPLGEPMPEALPVLLGGAAPDAERDPVAQRPAQARLAHRAGLADPLGPADLLDRGTRGPDREEQLGINLTARGVQSPACARGQGFRRARRCRVVHALRQLLRSTRAPPQAAAPRRASNPILRSQAAAHISRMTGPLTAALRRR